MHPDLFLRIYRQQERELEERLRHRLVARDRAVHDAPALQARAGAGVARSAAVRWFDGLSGRLQRDVLDGKCCAAV